MSKKISIIFLTVFLLVSGGILSAHPGVTDHRGGHNCWQNCEEWGLHHGEYHIHEGEEHSQYEY